MLTVFAIAVCAIHAPPPLDGAVIVVDPGHGGQRYSKSYTGGTKGVSSRLTESELNLRVSLELAGQLKKAGATVHLTRIADHRLSREGSSNSDELHARIDFFEHHNPHFFLSVHHNAGPESATGHTALYKHNATDDTLYEQLATLVNDSLATAVPGPKRKLIKQSYHILRETDIPGTISEAGFMTNKAFDELCNTQEFPAKEAEAIVRGAIDYWTRHRAALIALRTRLSSERTAKPRDPKSITAIELNVDFRRRMDERLNAIEPSGKYDAKRAADYLTAFRKLLNIKPDDMAMTATWDGQSIRLAGMVAKREYHDQFIDLLVAMKLYSIENAVQIPKP